MEFIKKLIKINFIVLTVFLLVTSPVYATYTEEELTCNLPEINGCDITIENLAGKDEALDTLAYGQLTYRDIFGDSLYGTGKTNLSNMILPYTYIHNISGFSYYNVTINNDHSIDNHYIYHSIDYYIDYGTLNVNKGLYFTNSPTLSNVRNITFDNTLTEGSYSYIENLLDYRDINIWLGTDSGTDLSLITTNYFIFDLTTLFSGHVIPTQEQFEDLLLRYKYITSNEPITEDLYIETLDGYYYFSSEYNIYIDISATFENTQYDFEDLTSFKQYLTNKGYLDIFNQSWKVGIDDEITVYEPCIYEINEDCPTYQEMGMKVINVLLDFPQFAMDWGDGVVNIYEDITQFMNGMPHLWSSDWWAENVWAPLFNKEYEAD